jgi:hypothetical protein
MISFWARRTDNCKYLSNSPAVSLLVRIYKERKSAMCYPKHDCLYKRYAQAGIEYQRQ